MWPVTESNTVDRSRRLVTEKTKIKKKTEVVELENYEIIQSDL